MDMANHSFFVLNQMMSFSFKIIFVYTSFNFYLNSPKIHSIEFLNIKL